MVKDFRYIIRRVIIGVLIALILGFLSTRKANALTSNFDSALMCSTNMGCSTSLSLPYSYAYSDSARINFSGINLIQGKSYSINFTMTLNSPNFSFNLDYPQLFVIDSSANPVRAYPDRGNSLQVNNLGNNNYSVVWNFELDNTGGNFTSAYVIFTFTSSYNQSLYSTTINSSNFLYYDLSDPTGNQDIINNQNNNTNIINNNINSNFDELEESQKVCESVDIKMNYNDRNNFTSGFLLSNGNINQSSTTFISSYESISANQSYTISTNKYTLGNTSSYCIYDSNKTLISCETYNNRSSVSFTPSSDGFVRYSAYLFESGAVVSFTGKTCKNGNQAISDEMQDINNSINDDSAPDSNSFISDLQNLTPSSTPITDLLTMPLTLMNALLTGINGSCSTFSLGTLYGVQLSLPCIDLQSLLGSGLWTIIDGLCAFFMIMGIGRLCIRIYENITSLNDPLNMIYGGGR